MNFSYHVRQNSPSIFCAWGGHNKPQEWELWAEVDIIEMVPAEEGQFPKELKEGAKAQLS